MGRKGEAHNVALGKAIRQLRKGAKRTQRDLAKRAGISVKELRQIERGAVDADWGMVRHLAYAMETKLADVFRLTEQFETGSQE
ncbi:MAG TPA: helix-turn-helix transcriptional regulator [Solirubrobacterales bacterium]